MDVSWAHCTPSTMQICQSTSYRARLPERGRPHRLRDAQVLVGRDISTPTTREDSLHAEPGPGLVLNPQQ